MKNSNSILHAYELWYFNDFVIIMHYALWYDLVNIVYCWMLPEFRINTNKCILIYLSYISIVCSRPTHTKNRNHLIYLFDIFLFSEKVWYPEISISRSTLSIKLENMFRYVFFSLAMNYWFSLFDINVTRSNIDWMEKVGLELL